MKCQKSSRVESRSECLEQSEASEVNGEVVCAGAVIGDCADIVVTKPRGTGRNAALPKKVDKPLIEELQRG